DQSRCARMATMTSRLMTAHHTDIMGPTGSAAACSSEPGLGSTAPTTSTATLITASIHIAATLVHIQTMETSPSITSMETRCVTDAATPVVEATQVVEATARNSVKLKAKWGLLKGARLVGSGNNFPVADRLRSSPEV